MGKNLQRRQSGLPFENDPGCMWSVLQLLNYHQWHRVKKMLPYKRNGSKRHNSMGEASSSSTGTTTDHANKEKGDCKMENRMKRSSSSTKGSVTMRIKSLISEEMSKKKGRHYRSSTCPAESQLMRTMSIHHMEPSENDPFFQTIQKDESTRFADRMNEESSASSSEYSSQRQVHGKPSSMNKRCESCGTELAETDLVNNHDSEHEKQFSEAHGLRETQSFETRRFEEKLEKSKEALLEQKLMNAKELTGDASLYQSKEFMDALNLISTNKELFLRILQNPGSSLARHFHDQRQQHTKVELTKCGTFPAAGLTGKRDIGGSKLKQKNDVGSRSERKRVYRECDEADAPQGELKSSQSFRGWSMPLITDQYGMGKYSRPRSETSDDCSPRSTKLMKLRGKNQAAIKRFRDLKQKIFHVIKENKKERHRVGMDAILHKVPYGQTVSEDVHWKEPAIDPGSPNSLCGNFGSNISPSSSRFEGHHIRRASSLKGSLDKYSQLFESSCTREAKSPISERLKLRKEDDNLSSRNASKSLGRIHSLPNIMSQFQLRSEDSYDAFALPTPSRNITESNRSIGTGSNEQKVEGIPIESENKILQNLERDKGENEEDSFLAPGAGEESALTADAKDIVNAEVDQLPGKLDKMTAEAKLPLIEQDAFSIRHPTIEGCSDSQPVSLIGPSEAPTTEVIESKELDKEADTPTEPLDGDFLHFRVDTMDEAEFNYVRDVLELSGFSRNELLGTWHGNDQPVDPSVFEVVESCLLDGTYGYENEESSYSKHLLMFDLINEVLMDSYEKSFTYCPVLLSSLSHIRPMPFGNHVLEEVWSSIKWYLRFRPELDQSLDFIVNQDLSKYDGWMNLRFDTECVGLEIEELVFNDLIEEALSV